MTQIIQFSRFSSFLADRTSSPSSVIVAGIWKLDYRTSVHFRKTSSLSFSVFRNPLPYLASLKYANEITATIITLVSQHHESSLIIIAICNRMSFVSTLAFIIDQACLLQSFHRLYLPLASRVPSPKGPFFIFWIFSKKFLKIFWKFF